MPSSNIVKAQALERRLEALKRDILFVSQFETQNLEGDELFRFQAKLTSAKECWAEFKSAWNERDELQARLKGEEQQFPTDEWLELRDQLRDEIIEADSILLRLQRSSEASQADTANQTLNTSFGCSSKPSLPKIQIPTFSGDILHFSHFKDTFISLVHSQPGLSGIEKFHYLLSSLKGEAAALISGFPVEESSYSQAWNKVVSTYGNTRVLASFLINRILDYDYSKHRNEQQRYESFLTSVADSVEAFTALKLGDPCGFVLASLALRALDPETRREFELSLKSIKELPKPSDVFGFVRQRKTALKIAQDLRTPNRNAASGSISYTPQRGSRYPNRESRRYNSVVLHSTSTHGNGSRKPALDRTVKNTPHKSNRPASTLAKCPHCEEAHQLYGCAAFHSLTSQERATLARSWKICLNCLKPGHATRECRSKYLCRFCKSKHHSLIHGGTKEESGVKQVPEEQQPSTFIGFGSARLPKTSQVLLGTAQILVKGPRGDFHSARAVLDSGSQQTFITQSLANKIGACISPFSGSITGLGGSDILKGHLKGTISCVLRASTNIDEYPVSSVVVEHIASTLPSRSLPSSISAQLQQEPLADYQFADSGPVDVLIGADLFPRLITGTPRHSGIQDLFLLPTTFGLVVTGRLDSLTPVPTHSFYMESQAEVEAQLKRFWDTEEPLSVDRRDPDDRFCEEHFARTHSRNLDGRYVVRLPFKPEHGPLGCNRGAVSRRFQTLETKLRKSITLSHHYADFMEEYAKLGHMSPSSTQADYLIPHHGVWQEGPKGTKLRVVFDASCPSTTCSLNDMLLSGPKLQEDLSQILIRFRMYAIALCTDVVKMYRQILVHPTDRIHQHILWRHDPLGAITEYELNTVTYGVKPSAFLALRVIKQLLIDEGSPYPLAASRVANDMYVDDLVSGADSLEEATQLYIEFCALFKKGGFELSKWASSVPDLIAPSDERVDYISIKPEEDDCIKILGLIWRSPQDSFSYSVQQPPSQQISKRSMLSAVAKIFDPLGLLSPVILLTKSLIQEVWKAGVGWDDPLPSHIAQEWHRITYNWAQLAQVSIPRYITFPQASHILIGYCDASSRGYAAAAYLRAESPKGEVRVTLIKAKTKVAPLKYLSISRLELCGALLLSRLVSSLPSSLINHVVCYTDSRVVLSWLRTPSHLLRTFEANRVAQIVSAIPSVRWCHVKSQENPADLASRGCTPENLLKNEIWWNGPDLLRSPTENWTPVDLDRNTSVEMKTLVQLASKQEAADHEWLSRFSSYDSLVRNSARILRFMNRKTATPERFGPITAEEFARAEARIIRLVQRYQLPKELFQDNAVLPKAYASLDPFKDEAGIIRVGGRLHHAPIRFSTRHPVLLPPKSSIARLIITKVHTQHFHSGPTLTLSLLRSKFWIPRAAKLIRSVITRCIPCRLRTAKPSVPLMGTLPPERFQQFRAFSTTGVDYAGPFQIKESNRRNSATGKGYLCLFVCLASKALHLELVSSLSTPSFLAALERFIARRGVPNCICSDHGTNFVGASRFLKDVYLFHRSIDNKVIEHLAPKGIEWKFIPPRAPHFGGIWEAGVKQIKKLLASSIGGHPQTFEELCTTLARIEGLLNSRPLCSLSEDVNNFQFLTPGHFLIGAPLTPLPETSEPNLSNLSRWRLVQAQVASIWNRWRREYLHTLQQRTKWTRKVPNIREGDLVILMERRLLVGQWPVARVVETVPGRDGTVRTVVVRTPSGNLLTRAVSSIVPLFHPDEAEPSVVISAYCRGRKNAKPLSQVLMDIYHQAVVQVSLKSELQVSPWTPEKKSTKLFDAKSQHRLYRQPAEGGKYFGPTTVIGPEFIIRASEPTPVIHLGDAKASIRKRLLVVLLNGQKLEFTCDPSTTTIGDIFQIIVRREQLDYPVTLGLSCLISGDFVFPPADKKLVKIAPQPWPKSPFTVYLRFQLYLPSLRGTRSWKWKHLLYLQLRRSLLERQLRAGRAQLLALAGLSLQAEFGDHATVDKSGRTYFLTEHYLPENEAGDRELEALHRRRAGLDPGKAEEMFITHCSSLAEYGTHFISALVVNKEGNSSDVWVGVNSKGLIMAYKRDFASGVVREPHYSFSWPDIKKLSYSKHYFEITSANYKFKLKLDSNKSCYLFHLAWLHHKFFMKLTNEFTTLQAISEEFGDYLKPGKKGVLHVSPNVKRTTELGALRRAASLLSPDRAIFRGKTSSHCLKGLRSESYRESRAPSCTSTPLSHTSSSRVSDISDGSAPKTRRRPLMGTRAIFSNSQHDLRSSSSQGSLDFPSPITSEPYLLNTNIKCADNKYNANFQETISDSLAEKFDKAACFNERILTSVRLERSKEGSLGLHVTEGKDGHVYILSTMKGTPAAECGRIYSGDQIQAVNGMCVLGLSYMEVLRLIQNCGQVIELVLSQDDRGQPQVSCPALDPLKVSQETGIDLIGVLQKGIEASYLKTIRYETATESESEIVISTDIPRPVSYI